MCCSLWNLQSVAFVLKYYNASQLYKRISKVTEALLISAMQITSAVFLTSAEFVFCILTLLAVDNLFLFSGYNKGVIN